MNSEIKKEWIEALRSGKYEQGKDVLKSDDKYCCLGILCDIHAKKTGNVWEETCYLVDSKEDVPEKSYLGSTAVLPYDVIDWAALEDKADHDAQSNNSSDVLIVLNGESTTLSIINDGGSSFKEIADLIEEQL